MTADYDPAECRRVLVVTPAAHAERCDCGRNEFEATLFRRDGESLVLSCRSLESVACLVAQMRAPHSVVFGRDDDCDLILRTIEAARKVH